MLLNIFCLLLILMLNDHIYRLSSARSCVDNLFLSNKQKKTSNVQQTFTYRNFWIFLFYLKIWNG